MQIVYAASDEIPFPRSALRNIMTRSACAMHVQSLGMQRKETLLARFAKRFAMFCGIGLALLGCERASEPDPRRPNVLLVTIDTLRADHVGVYGSSLVQTPTLDSLAVQGVRFANAYSTAPTTAASHTSILTGLYPTRHGVRHNGIFQVRKELETLPEQMQAKGYETAAVVSAFVLAAQFGFNQGFGFYDDAMSRFAGVGGYAERTADEVTDSALDWLKKKRKKPFFLWVHYYDPHAEYQPPSPYKERYAEHLYAGEVAFVDEQLGRLVEGLRAQKQFDNTLILVTSDHGESLGEHGEVTHSYTLYDATLAVPLIVCGPQIPAGQTVDGVVSTAGIMPTVLSLLGWSVPIQFDGLDLSRFWKGNAAQETPAVYAETLSTQLVHGWAPLFALHSQHQLYVRAPHAELYDVRQDPHQIANRLDNAKDFDAVQQAHDLDAQLETLLSVQKPTTANQDVDAQTLQQLAKLGYAAPTTADAAQSTHMDPKEGLKWLAAMYQARDLFYAGDFESADQVIASVVQNMPNSFEALSLKAEIDRKAHRFEAARRSAEKAVQLSPHTPETKVLLGFLCREMGDDACAVQEFREIERMNIEQSSEAEVGIMWTYVREGKVFEADLHEKKARAAVPTEQGLLYLGKTWEQAGEYERALKAYEFALEKFPASNEANAMLAIQMARLGEEGKASQYWARAGQEAQNPMHRNRLGIVYAARGELEKAEKIFLGVLAQHPDYAPARENLERVRAKKR